MDPLEDLPSLVGKYVSVTDPSGEGLSGWVTEVTGISEKEGVRGRWLAVDYGMGWFVTQSTNVEEVEAPKLVGSAKVDNERDLLLYGGQPLPTEYGHVISVRESSASNYPSIWLRVEPSENHPSVPPHLGLAEAIALREALDQFIKSVPDRWIGGSEMLEAGHHAAYGTNPNR